MFYQKGLNVFGERGANAVVSEMHQLDQLNTIVLEHSDNLTTKQKQEALKYLMYLKEKRIGVLKGHGCADGWPQCDYLMKEDTRSAPTVSTEALFLSKAVDTHEGPSEGGCHCQKIPTTIQIILIKKIQFYSESLLSNNLLEDHIST
jgi:hypothetical protein